MKNTIFKNILTITIIDILLLGGCGLVDKLQSWKSGENNNPPVITDPNNNNQNPNPNPGEPPDPNDNNPSPNNPDPTVAMRTITLYFANTANTALVAETRQIPQEVGIARATINQLINGPKNKELNPTIPNDATLDDINIKDGVCIVDFSSELKDHHPGGLVNEQLTIYSIVNTLSQFSTVNSVRILVDGKEITSLAGHIDTTAALAPNFDIVN